MQREEVSGILTKKFWWKFCTVTPAFVSGMDLRAALYSIHICSKSRRCSSDSCLNTLVFKIPFRCGLIKSIVLFVSAL